MLGLNPESGVDSGISASPEHRQPTAFQDVSGRQAISYPKHIQRVCRLART